MVLHKASRTYKYQTLRKQSHGVGIAPIADNATKTSYDYHRALKNGYITGLPGLIV